MKSPDPSLPSDQNAVRRRRYSALALLLTYPQREWLAVLPDVSEAAQPVSPGARHRGLDAAVEYLTGHSLLELQEHYVAAFDRSRTISLHLFEHSHGDARERGVAMARLRELYAAAGWELAAGELPDYLPAVCEFLGLAEVGLATALLDECLPVLQRLHEQLVARQSPYAGVLDALLGMHDGVVGLGERGAERAADSTDVRIEPRVEADVRAEDLTALDEQWAEQPVTFSPGAAHDSLLVPAARLVRGAEPVSTSAPNPLKP